MPQDRNTGGAEREGGALRSARNPDGPTSDSQRESKRGDGTTDLDYLPDVTDQEHVPCASGSPHPNALPAENDAITRAGNDRATLVRPRPASAVRDEVRR